MSKADSCNDSWVNDAHSQSSRLATSNPSVIHILSCTLPGGEHASKSIIMIIKEDLEFRASLCYIPGLKVKLSDIVRAGPAEDPDWICSTELLLSK